MASKELKESSCPVQLADRAISDALQEEPAFTWWLPLVQKKCEATMNKVKSKHFLETCGCDLRIPKTWKGALQAGRENGDHLWEDAIEQEMKNGQVAFQTHNRDVEDPIGCKQTTCHLIFVSSFQNASGGKQGLQLTVTRFQLPHP